MRALLLFGVALLGTAAAAQRPDTASLTNVWRFDTVSALVTEIRQVHLLRGRRLIGVCLFVTRFDGRVVLLSGMSLTDTLGGPAPCARRWHP